MTFYLGFGKVAKLPIFMLKTILKKSIKYLLILVDMVNKNEISSREYWNKKKSRNEMIKILTKLKSWNLLKSRFENLFKSKKIQNTRTIKKPNFLTFNAKIVFTKLKYVFT